MKDIMETGKIVQLVILPAKPAQGLQTINAPVVLMAP